MARHFSIGVVAILIGLAGLPTVAGSADGPAVSGLKLDRRSLAPAPDYAMPRGGGTVSPARIAAEGWQHCALSFDDGPQRDYAAHPGDPRPRGRDRDLFPDRRDRGPPSRGDPRLRGQRPRDRQPQPRPPQSHEAEPGGPARRPGRGQPHPARPRRPARPVPAALCQLRRASGRHRAQRRARDRVVEPGRARLGGARRRHAGRPGQRRRRTGPGRIDARDL